MQLKYPQKKLYWHDFIYDLQDLLADTPDVFLVGGIVRDIYQDRPFKDVDLVCDGDGNPIARRIANGFQGDYYALDKARGVGRAIVHYRGEKLIIDVAAMRGDELLDDLTARDFTINAMAVPLGSDLTGIYDPLGGLEDWNQKIVRQCADDAIESDPIRALRAVRQSLSYGFAMEPQTREAARQYGPHLSQTSDERVRDEFFALLNGKKPIGGLQVLRQLGLLEAILPVAQAIENADWREVIRSLQLIHTLLTVISPRRDDNIAANVSFGTFVYLLDRFRPQLQAHIMQDWPEGRVHLNVLLFGQLLRAIGAYTEVDLGAIARHMKLSRAESDYLKTGIASAAIPLALHRSGSVAPRAIYRYWREFGPAGFDGCIYASIDFLMDEGLQVNAPAWTAYLQDLVKILEPYNDITALNPFLSGDDLQTQLEMPPGKAMGQLLEQLREEQFLGAVTSPEEALAFAETWLA